MSTSTVWMSPACRVEPEVSRLSTYSSPFGARPVAAASWSAVRPESASETTRTVAPERWAPAIAAPIRASMTWAWIARDGSMIASGVDTSGGDGSSSSSPGALAVGCGVLGRAVVA